MLYRVSKKKEKENKTKIYAIVSTRHLNKQYNEYWTKQKHFDNLNEICLSVLFCVILKRFMCFWWKKSGEIGTFLCLLFYFYFSQIETKFFEKCSFKHEMRSNTITSWLFKTSHHKLSCCTLFDNIKWDCWTSEHTFYLFVLTLLLLLLFLQMRQTDVHDE